jgi:predicted lipoprotein with Yx(FWY)xxD motif
LKPQEAIKVLRSRSIAVAATLATVAGGAAATFAQSAGAATARPASAAVLKVQSVQVSTGTSNKSHQVLVNSKGLPVYILTGDSKSHPKCTSSNCLSAWPAVRSKSMKPTLGKGVKGKVGVWHHNGMNQVTLNGQPLYTFASDSAGSASGQGLKSFGGTWWLLTASGSAMANSSSKSSSGGGGGGW